MSAHDGSAYLLHSDRPQVARASTYDVIRTAGPLLLAIAGSALSPLPCAFSLTGVPVGTVLMLAIALANDYTTVIMVRAASKANVSGCESLLPRTAPYAVLSTVTLTPCTQLAQTRRSSSPRAADAPGTLLASHL